MRVQVFARGDVLEPNEVATLESRASHAWLHIVGVSFLYGPQRVGLVVVTLARDDLLAAAASISHLRRMQEVVVRKIAQPNGRRAGERCSLNELLDLLSVISLLRGGGGSDAQGG